MNLKKISSMIAKLKVIQQSGVIPYRIRDEKIEVLLITSSAGKQWLIPKGMIESFMSPQASAAKEAWEEGGVIGLVSSRAIGTYNYQRFGETFQVEVFLLQVETVFDDWPEAKIRKREWLSIKQAVKRVKEPELKLVLIEFANQLIRE